MKLTSSHDRVNAPVHNYHPRYVPWKPARPRATCPVTPWKLVAAEENGCTDAYCGTGPGGGRPCLCRDDRGETAVTLTTNGTALRLPVEVSAFNPWGSSFVDVTSADLDGDGSPEVMLSVLQAVSNGLGEEFRPFVVVRHGREMLRYDSGVLTAKTALVRVGAECHLQRGAQRHRSAGGPRTPHERP
ncbi:hypothetical protein WME76_32850 [Sorangium sp. So ce119]|uniref:hypothetical protein n=1 Tax=Sorangium sp. So ce119 TaxID=3133279 RepID=UPI003F5F7E6C